MWTVPECIDLLSGHETLILDRSGPTGGGTGVFTWYIPYCGVLHSLLWSVTFLTVECYIPYCGVLHSLLWGVTFLTVECYIPYCGVLHSLLWSVTFLTVECYIPNCGVLHSLLCKVNTKESKLQSAANLCSRNNNTICGTLDIII